MTGSIEYGKFYHVFNRGNNKDIVFFDKDDYKYFLELYKIFVSSVATTHSWCLMKNHFHFLVQIKEQNEIGYLNPKFAKSNDLKTKWSTSKTLSEPPSSDAERSWKKPKPGLQFRHLFSTYTVYINRKYGRTGSVLEKKYEKKIISDYNYLTEAILYINNNPVKHGIVKSAERYKWSSIHEIVNHENSVIENFELLWSVFNDSKNFLYELERFSNK
ncbi:MAG: transposase [Bacteroidales bacterium]|nr:transposase [Bacteroidales bacterium]